MKFINKFFEPYEKYSISTTLSEEELKEIFPKEFASWYNILPDWMRQMFETCLRDFEKRKISDLEK